LKFGAATVGDTYEASFLDIVEHGGHGRLLVFDPEAGDTRVLMHGLNFANGVAISPDQQYLLVAETSAYRILKFWIEGPDAGTSEPLLENLPGFPDNINSGFRSRFWVGLIAPRNELLDRLSNAPRARKVIMRLPRALRPRAEPSSHVVGFDGTGQVLMNLQDTSARFPSLTGVLETRDALYLSTLFGNHVPRLDKRDLVRN
jgi:sugar lactone lactonase YvrE